MSPNIQIAEHPRQPVKLGMQHKRWKSNPEKEKRPDMVQPFSYEYRFEDGRLTGLAEYHGDVDHAHYSALRTRREVTIGNYSARTSKDDLQYRATMDSRTSHSRHGSRATATPPPGSPSKGDALKRALTLHGLKRRASSDVRQTLPPSPYSPRPEIEKLAASFGPRGPQHITSPKPLLPAPKHDSMFESPRTAPRPPSRDSSKLSPLLAPSPLLLGEPLKPSHSRAQSHDRIFTIVAPPILPRSPLVDLFTLRPLQEEPVTNNMVSELPSIPMKALSPRLRELPVSTMEHGKAAETTATLRRKPSKFIEHIERKERLSPRTRDNELDEIPPVPPMVLGAHEFNHPINGRIISIPIPMDSHFSLQSNISNTLDLSLTPSAAGSFVVADPSARQSYMFSSSPPDSRVRSPTYSSGDHSASLTIKRSSSLVARKSPTTSVAIGRSMTTKSRSVPLKSDVCMAQTRPVLTSGIIAQGHARMISC